MQNNTDTLNIVLDLKGEYLNRFYKPGDKVLCLHDTENFPNEKWSIMREILSSPYPETAAAEIADSLFAEAVRQSSQTFFPRSARTVWEVYTRLMIRKFSKTPPTNLQLITSILSFDADKLIVECKPYPELLGVKPLLAGAAPTVMGIKAELNQVLYDTFRGSFCSEGSFSICDYVRNNTGTVFLLSSLNELQSCKNAFRIIIDLAIKEAISKTKKAEKVYFFLDELPIIGRLSNLSTLLNFGAGFGAYAVIGTQNIAQLNSVYGESEANSLLSGIRTHIVFGANDTKTAEYFSARSGTKQRSTTKVGIDRKAVTTTAELPAVSTEEFLHLKTGQAFYFDSGAPAKYIFFDK